MVAAQRLERLPDNVSTLSTCMNRCYAGEVVI